jgi:biopolymer transport protein ExbD
MTPFVDVAFLILSFFMLATKFKPEEAVTITTPFSVSSDKLKEEDALLVEMAPDGRVFFTMQTKSGSDLAPRRKLIQSVNTGKNLGLTNTEVETFVSNPTVGVPFSQLKQYLGLAESARGAYKLAGIPVDSANNELAYWLGAGNTSFYGRKVYYMIRGDNDSKYPSFKGVIDAFRRNELYKYRLITSPEEAPRGTDLYRQKQQKKAAGGDAAAKS